MKTNYHRETEIAETKRRQKYMNNLLDNSLNSSKIGISAILKDSYRMKDNQQQMLAENYEFIQKFSNTDKSINDQSIMYQYSEHENFQTA